MTEPVWTAEFPDGCMMYVMSDSWVVDGPDSMAVHALKRQFASHLTEVPWPQMAGFSYDTTPGWDPDLMYVRLLSIGGRNVTGPQPVEPEVVEEPGTIVG